MKEKIANAENINVVGIIKQNEQSTATAMNGGIGYLKDLKEYVINKTKEADIVKEQKVNPETNVFTGLEFPKSGEKSEFNFNNLSNERKNGNKPNVNRRNCKSNGHIHKKSECKLWKQSEKH